MKSKISLWVCILLLSPSYFFAQTAGFVASTDATNIYYRLFGKGKPLLIINGGPGMNSNGFENLAKILSENNQAILYDQRGTGKSVLQKLDSTTLTMQLMLDDIECLRKQLGIEKWAILGHSFGGIVAAMYATQYPEHIEKIIFSSSGGIDLDLLSYVGAEINAKLSKEELADFQYWTAKIQAGDTTYAARLARGKALAPAYLYDREFIPTLAERLTQGNSTINQLMWDDLHRIHYDCSEALKDFTQPVLIIQGKQDIIHAKTAEKAQSVLPNAKVVFMEHCGHYGWLDNPEVYFQELSTFLREDEFQPVLNK